MGEHCFLSPMIFLAAQLMEITVNQCPTESTHCLLEQVQLDVICESEEEVLWAKTCIKAMYVDDVLPTSEAFEAVSKKNECCCQDCITLMVCHRLQQPSIFAWALRLSLNLSTQCLQVACWAETLLSSHVLKLCLR